MKLVECYIENFGKLHNFSYKFDSQLNVIKEDNGYGKTTFTVFLKSMLYGLTKTKNTKITENERKHYQPWQKGYWGGWLIIEAKGKLYRIEREFNEKYSKDKFVLYDERSGKISNDYTENIGEELFEIDADGFERTIFLSEANISGTNDNKTVSAKLSDLAATEADLSIMDEAIARLDNERKRYEKKGGKGEIYDLKTRLGVIEEKLLNLADAEKQISENYAKIALLKEKLTAAEEKKKRCEEKIREHLEREKLQIHQSYYETLKSNAKMREKEVRDAENFFNGYIPTSEEIYRQKSAYDAYLQEKEALNKHSCADASSENKYNISESEKEEIDSLINKLNRIDVLTEDLNERLNRQTERISSKEDYKPQRAEYVMGLIERHTLLSSYKKRKKSYLALFPAAILSLAAAILFYKSLAVLSVSLLSVSAVMFIISAVNFTLCRKNKKHSRELSQFNADFFAMTGFDSRNTDVGKVLSEYLTFSQSYYENEKAEINYYKELDALKEEKKALNIEACQILCKFPDIKNENIKDALRKILDMCNENTTLMRQEKTEFEERKRRSNIIFAEYQKALEFINRYNIGADNKFEFLADKLNRYKNALFNLNAAVMECEKYQKNNNFEIDGTSRADTADVGRSYETEIAEISRLSDEIKKELINTEKENNILSQKTADKDALVMERDTLREKIEKSKDKLETIIATMHYLESAKDNITEEYLYKTKNAFKKYISELSAEQAKDFMIDTSFNIMKTDLGGARESDAYSRGTRDIFNLCMRFALIDSLYEKEKPFIILDDPFAHLDDKGIKRGLELLNNLKQSRQIIYITCRNERS